MTFFTQKELLTLARRTAYPEPVSVRSDIALRAVLTIPPAGLARRESGELTYQLSRVELGASSPALLARWLRTHTAPLDSVAHQKGSSAITQSGDR